MNKVLEEKVKEIRLTHRLTDTPACIVQDEGDLGPQMAQILKAAGQAVPDSKPILELNPEHLFVKKLEQEQDEEDFSEWANLLLEQAILAERGQLDDPMTFTTRLNRMLLKLSN
jgi:molecular chaperone HtpG